MVENQYGFVRNGKVYRKAIGDYPEVEIGEVKDTEEAALAYYEQRFQQLVEKINQLEADVHSTVNKGSYLMKLLHLKSILPTYEGLGDYKPLLDKLNVLEEHIREIIEQNRHRNLEIKTALLAEAEQLKEVNNWKEGTEMAKDLKMRWIKTGSLSEEHQKEFEGRFESIISDFFERRNAFYEERNQMIQERIQQYRSLIERARKVAAGNDLREASRAVRSLQYEWKNIGQVPAQERRELWNEFSEATAPVFNAIKRQRYQAMKRQNEQALAEKRELIKKLNQISGVGVEVIRQVNALEDQFKNLGRQKGPGVADITNEFFETASLIKERSFLHRLANNKITDFYKKDPKEQAKLKMKLLKDLLARDERELQAFRDNMAKLNSGENRFNRMMDSKLRGQERKVRVKYVIYEELREQAE